MKKALMTLFVLLIIKEIILKYGFSSEARSKSSYEPLLSNLPLVKGYLVFYSLLLTLFFILIFKSPEREVDKSFLAHHMFNTAAAAAAAVLVISIGGGKLRLADLKKKLSARLAATFVTIVGLFNLLSHPNGVNNTPKVLS